MLPKKKPIRKDNSIIAHPAVSSQSSILSSCASCASSLTPSAGIDVVEIVETVPGAHKTTSLLDLPLEIRARIYKHVLALDEYALEVKHYTSLSKCQRRHISYVVSNINHYHFAITAVSHQISNEIKANVPAQSLKFASTSALDDFLLCEKAGEVSLMMGNLNVLYKDERVEVMVKKRPVSPSVREHCAWLYETLADLLPKFLTIELVSEETSDERFKIVFERIASSSDSRMEDLEGKLFGWGYSRGTENGNLH